MSQKHCCQDCGDRWIDVITGKNCHGSCERYARFKEELAERKKREQLDKVFHQDKKKVESNKRAIRDFHKRRAEGKKAR